MRKEYRQNIRRAGLSATAREVMYDLGDESSEKRPHVVINVRNLSESIGVSASTVRRAVRELVEKGLLVFEGLVVSMHHKVYKLSFELLQTAKKIASKIAKAPQKKEAPNVKIEFAESEQKDAQEVIDTLHSFGCFTKDEAIEITYKHTVERAREMILQYLQELTTGHAHSARDWFRARPPSRFATL